MNLFLKKLFLAPMAGVSDTCFRQICKTCGADIVVSEMISAEGTVRRSKKTLGLLAHAPSEQPFGIQIFGSDPDKCAETALFIQEQYKPAFIDLNSGCPVPKVVNKNGGAALLKNQKLFEKILTSMTKTLSIPVTVKIRSGWQVHQWVDTEFAKIAQDSGCSAIALHPRSKTMGYSGHSFWERIALVKKAVSIPVIGNGDITSAEKAKAMLEQTGCDSIMIGRAACGNPWIFTQIKHVLNTGTLPSPSPHEKLSLIIHHIDLYIKNHGELRACSELKKHCAWYLKAVPHAAEKRNQIFRAHTTDQLKAIISDAFQLFT